MSSEKANFSLPQVRGRIKDTKNKRLLMKETNSSLKCQSIIQKSTKKSIIVVKTLVT